MSGRPIYLSRWQALAAAAMLTCIATACASQNGESAFVKEPAPVTVARSSTFLVTSDVNGRAYKIFVAEPSGEAPPNGFPVIYMTDANMRFLTMTETVRSWARGRSAGSAEAIIVGIGYPDGVNVGVNRSLDLTPALGDAPTPDGFGGASDFLKFILVELKPFVQERYHIDETRQALFGHSFGGLFALHTLFNQPDAFQTYLVSSPSIWWGERFILNVLPRLSPKLETSGATPRVLVTVGELEQSKTRPADQPASRPVLPGVLDRMQVDDARNITAKLKKTPGVAAEFVLFDDEMHGTVPPAAMSRSVRYFFDKKVALPERAQTPPDLAGETRTTVPSVREYVAMSPDERYRLRLDVRTWPDDERRRFLTQLKYNLDAGLWYDEHHGLHVERNELDRKFGTEPPALFDRNRSPQIQK